MTINWVKATKKSTASAGRMDQGQAEEEEEQEVGGVEIKNVAACCF